MAGVVGAGSRQIVAVAPDIENVQRERRFIQGVFERDEPFGHLHRRVHWWHERVRASRAAEQGPCGKRSGVTPDSEKTRAHVSRAGRAPAGAAASERACRGVRGAKPLG